MDHIAIQRETYLSAIRAPGVNVLPVVWASTVKPAAAHKAHVLTKRVHATVMTGQEYSKLAVNNDRETGALPWGQWAEYPYLVEHKGQDYARLNVVAGTIRSAYFVDGVEVTRAKFNAMLTPSAANAEPPVGGTITVKLENLTILA